MLGILLSSFFKQQRCSLRNENSFRNLKLSKLEINKNQRYVIGITNETSGIDLLHKLATNPYFDLRCHSRHFTKQIQVKIGFVANL